MGYIRQDEESLKYAVSEVPGDRRQDPEQTNMASGSSVTEETVGADRRDGPSRPQRGTEAVYIDKVESNVSSIRMVSRVGSRIPCTAPASAKGAARGAAGSGDQRDLEQLRRSCP